MADLWAPGLLALAFGALFAAAELLHRVFHVRAEVTRKLVHVGTGLLTLLFPLFLNLWWVLALCGGFFLILLASLRWSLLPSINAVGRETYGSLVYPVIVSLVFVFFERLSAWQGRRGLLWFYLPILIMALCDPLAAFVGKLLPLRPFHVGASKKSLGGTGAFVVGAFALSWAAFLAEPGFSREPVVQASTAVAVALTSAAAEALGGKGWDNLTIPLAVAGVLAAQLLMGAPV